MRQIKKSYKLAAALYELYCKVNRDYFAFIAEMENLKSSWIVSTLIAQLVEDVLAPDISTGEVLQLSSEKPEIARELGYLQEIIDFDRLLVAILPDLLLYGEYILSTRFDGDENVDNTPKQMPVFTEAISNIEYSPASSLEPDKDFVAVQSSELTNTEKSNIDSAEVKQYQTKEIEKGKNSGGLIALCDDIVTGSVIALANFMDIERYLYLEDNKRILFKSKAEYVRFSIQNRKIDAWQELKLTTEEIKEYNIPRFIRVGRSVFYGCLDKIKELQLLESLIPATKLMKLTSGTTVGVNVPVGYDIDKAVETTKKVEGVLNKKLSVDYKNKSISVADVVNSVGRIKVVPIFGDKGQLSKLDYKQDEPDDLMSGIEDLRRVISSSVGVPYEFLFSGDATRNETLRRHSRYLRKLKSIQKSLCDGVREIVYIHLANKGIVFKRDDIIVNFRNKLVEIDQLDRLEFTDASLTILSNILRFVQENAETPIADYVDEKELINYIKEQTRLFGLDIFKTDKKPEKSNKKVR